MPINDCYAQDALNKFINRVDKTEITQGQFKQEKRLKILKKPLISTGIFTYHRSRGVIWKTLSPAPSLLLVSERRLVIGQRQQSVPVAFGKVFKAVLGGDLTQLYEGFEVTADNKNKSWELWLTPKDDALKQLITGMRLMGDMEIRKLEISETNGNKSFIVFDRITHPAGLTSEQEADFAQMLSPR